MTIQDQQRTPRLNLWLRECAVILICLIVLWVIFGSWTLALRLLIIPAAVLCGGKLILRRHRR